MKKKTNFSHKMSHKTSQQESVFASSVGQNVLLSLSSYSGKVTAQFSQPSHLTGC